MEGPGDNPSMRSGQGPCYGSLNITVSHPQVIIAPSGGGGSRVSENQTLEIDLEQEAKFRDLSSKQMIIISLRESI